MEKVKIGIFGLWRGSSFIDIINNLDDAVIAAVCDSDKGKRDEALSRCPDGTKAYEDFDLMLDSGIDAVLLCNFFHQHTDYAIRAMEHGIHVFSECTSAATLHDCARLCDAVERTGCKYMIAENYPFSAALLEFKHLVDAGTLGRVLYAEGEYNHTGTREELTGLTPGKYHWRAWLPRTYYVTHTLGPLMYVTGQMPISVNAFAVHSDVLEEYDDFRHNFDAFAMMNCKTDGGALFRFTGCAAMGSASGYRVVGEYGSAETGRTLGGNVNLTYHHWTIPEGMQGSQTYEPHWHDNAELASKAGHGGGDFWTVYNFVNYILHDAEPFFNVYRGCAMSAVAILGWRSCLENGKTYDIPDFRDKALREKYGRDNLSPFPDANGNVTLPCAVTEEGIRKYKAAKLANTDIL